MEKTLSNINRRNFIRFTGITGAGLIMAVVFGAFIGADLPVLKMIGVGLCVSVLVDATLIRAFVVPAAMAIAGKWNWYPGRSQAP